MKTLKQIFQEATKTNPQINDRVEFNIENVQRMNPDVQVGFNRAVIKSIEEDGTYTATLVHARDLITLKAEDILGIV